MAASKSVINVAALCGSLCAAPSARLPSTAASSATVLFSSFILFPLNFSMYVMSIGELGFDFGCSDEAFQGSNWGNGNRVRGHIAIALAQHRPHRRWKVSAGGGSFSPADSESRRCTLCYGGEQFFRQRYTLFC